MALTPCIIEHNKKLNEQKHFSLVVGLWQVFVIPAVS